MLIKKQINQYVSFMRKGSLVFIFLCSYATYSQAQTLDVGGQATATATPDKNTQDAAIKNYKVLSETTNKDGSITRRVQYQRGNLLVTQTIISPPMPAIGYHKPINPDTMNHDSVLVYIDKKDYLLAVIYKRKRIRQYRAVFGPDRLGDKMDEGDRKTPEGWFKIVSKRSDSRWSKFILLNYPNDSSYARFNRRKREDLIPQNAKIGNNIGIHGTYPTGVGMVDIGLGWTDGCISLKPKDVDDLYNLVWPGTRVYIK